MNVLWKWRRWATEELELNFCKAKARELRRTGEYDKVKVRKTCTDTDRKDYGRIYVGTIASAYEDNPTKR